MTALKKILSYPLSLVFVVSFFTVLLLFHIAQWFVLEVLKKKTYHQKSVAYLNRTLLGLTPILGSTFTERNKPQIDVNQQYIVVANHQGMLDVPLLGWYLRKLKPKFISKKELGKNIPSISYNLRKGENLLIDRNDPRSAISGISNYAKTVLKKENYSIVIFPEGTRSKTGKPKPFATTGIKLLCKYLPEAHILPITIHNSWELNKYGRFPLGLFFSLELEYHEPIAVNSMPLATLLTDVESKITSTLKYS